MTVVVLIVATIVDKFAMRAGTKEEFGDHKKEVKVMNFPKNTIKIKNVNLEKGVALVCFANTIVNKNMRIESVDLFGGLRLRHMYKTDKAAYVVPNYEIGKWVTYSIEEPLEVTAQ